MRGQIFQINEVRAQETPPLYKLVDLLKDSVKGFYYKEELIKAPNPNYNNDFFEVEKILKTKIIKGEKFVLVKYLYYPSKFNQWLPEKNLKSANRMI